MESPAYFLPAHVRVRAIQDQAFFLDLKRNQYLATSLHELKGLSQVVNGWPADLDDGDTQNDRVERDIETTLADLARNHLLSRRPSRARGSSALLCPPAQKTLLEQSVTSYPPVCVHHLLSFLKATLTTGYYLSLRSLHSTVRRIERRRVRSTATTLDFAAARRLVDVFRRMRPLLPTVRAPCLVNSIALIEFLAAHGQFPMLVFGVQAHPFIAHCWVQHADVVLNSTLEEVVPFTPMMVA